MTTDRTARSKKEKAFTTKKIPRTQRILMLRVLSVLRVLAAEAF